MVKVYVDLIKKGLKTYNDVAATWKEGVKAAFEAEGYTLQEDGTFKKAEA